LRVGLQPNPIIHRVAETLFAAQVPLRRLHRDMPKKELNLLQFTTGLRQRQTKVRRRSCGARDWICDDVIRFLPLTYVFYRNTLFDMTAARRNEPPITLPTAAELDILAVLWRLGMATVREVHDGLGNENRYTTTLKTMQLMTEKGLLVRSERFGAHVYEASVPKEQTQRQIAGDLLKRVFGGSSRSLVIGALAAQPVSRKELDEIRGLLDAFEKEKGGSL
jgi:predicted transcriptional regulator